MRPDQRPDVLAWLHKAESDLQMADFAMTADLPDQACFHAQQAAEKALKSLLVADGRFVPRTHNLPLLLDTLHGTEWDTPEFVHRAAEVTLYAVGARYPDFDEPGTRQAADAVGFAQEVMAIVRRKLGL